MGKCHVQSTDTNLPKSINTWSQLQNCVHIKELMIYNLHTGKLIFQSCLYYTLVIIEGNVKEITKTDCINTRSQMGWFVPVRKKKVRERDIWGVDKWRLTAHTNFDCRQQALKMQYNLKFRIYCTYVNTAMQCITKLYYCVTTLYPLHVCNSLLLFYVMGLHVHQMHGEQV
jgi:hypothetical protein